MTEKFSKIIIFSTALELAEWLKEDKVDITHILLTRSNNYLVIYK